MAAYHSADPARGGPYRDRVLRFWRDLGGAPAATSPTRGTTPAARLADPHVIRVAAAGAAIPVYTPATLPAALRASLLALTQP